MVCFIFYSILENTDNDIVAGGHTYITTDNKEQYFHNNLSFGGDNKEKIVQSFYNSEFLFSLWAKIYKRSIFDKQNYTVHNNFTNSEDIFLFSEILTNNLNIRISTTNKSVYNYFQNIGSSMNRRLPLSAITSIILAWNKLYLASQDEPSLRSNFKKKIYFLIRSYMKSDYPKQPFLSDYSNYFNFDTIKKYENNIISSAYIYLIMNCRTVRWLNYKIRLLILGK